MREGAAMKRLYINSVSGAFLQITRREAQMYFKNDCMILVSPAHTTPRDYEQITKLHCVSKIYNRSLNDYISFLHRIYNNLSLRYYIPVYDIPDNAGGYLYRPLD